MTCQKNAHEMPNGTPKPPEPIDVYDEGRKPLGLVIDRRSQRLQRGQYMLYAIVMVCDPQGRLLITRRALDKAWAAGWWEVPGGGVMAGETTREAAVREVGEETGLDLSRARLELLDFYRNDDPGFADNYHADIYRAVLDFTEVDVRLRAREASEFRLAGWDEISGLGEEGLFLHYGRLAHALEKAAE